MTIRGTYVYKKAIKLTPERMQEINKLILRFYSNVEYACDVRSGKSMIFETVDEMLTCDNSLDKRIVSMIIKGKNEKNSIVFEIGINAQMNINDCTKILQCVYEFNNDEDELIFLDKLASIIKKSTLNYWFLTKTISFLYASSKENIPFRLSFLKFILRYIFKNIIQPITFPKLFSPVVFYWGEEVISFYKYEKRRTNIAYGIIFAAIVGILVGIAVYFIIKQFE